MRVKATTRENVFSLRHFSLRRFWRRNSKTNRVHRSSNTTTTTATIRQQTTNTCNNNSLRAPRVYSATSRDSVGQQIRPEVETKTGSQSVLVGDIGGTNARLSLWKITGDKYDEITEHWYPTKEYQETGLVSVLREFCTRKEVIESYPSTACFAIAGPVANNQGTMTNLGWTINGTSIAQEFNWKVAVINDFEALGYGIPLLEESDIVVLNDVPVSKQSPIAVLGPGTGLGEAQLMWDDSTCGYKVWPSEGAHADFAPRTEKQRALLKWISTGFGYCEVEHVSPDKSLWNAWSPLGCLWKWTRTNLYIS
eukprot:g6611.t1